MSERRHLYADANGVRRTLIWDTDDPTKVVVHTEQVLDEILDGIARDREFSAGRRAKDIEPSHRLPLFVYEDLFVRGIVQDDDAFRRWLNGPEGAPWRLWQGSV